MRLVAAFGCLFGLVSTVAAAPIRSDEEVLILPTAARLDPMTSEWVVPLHIWVFEPEHDSLRRQLLLRSVIDALDLNGDGLDGELARRRLAWFVVDNERNKTVTVRLADESFNIGPTAANGHAQTVVRIPTDKVAEGATWLTVELAPGQDALHRTFPGRVHLVPPRGVSVISDIDDTIKMSHVSDRQALIEAAFAKPYQPVEGMSALYQAWEARGVRFHYLSAAPWQLYPAYTDFLDEAGFPAGDITMRLFRLKDRTFASLLQDPLKYKVDAVAAMFQAFPDRQFVLVGDSTEQDPEVYGQVARRFPEQIRHIAIRRVGEVDDERLKDAFADVPGDVWTVFDDPEALREAVWVADVAEQLDTATPASELE